MRRGSLTCYTVSACPSARHTPSVTALASFSAVSVPSPIHSPAHLPYHDACLLSSRRHIAVAPVPALSSPPCQPHSPPIRLPTRCKTTAPRRVIPLASALFFLTSRPCSSLVCTQPRPTLRASRLPAHSVWRSADWFIAPQPLRNQNSPTQIAATSRSTATASRNLSSVRHGSDPGIVSHPSRRSDLHRGPDLQSAADIAPGYGNDPVRSSSSGGMEGDGSEGGGSITFLATCHPGFEQVVARELSALGYQHIQPTKAGVLFRASVVSDGYAANLWLRSAIRVLVLLGEGQLGVVPEAGRRGGQALYDLVYDAAPWHELIRPGATFSVEPRLWSCTDLSSTALVWSRVKDAVCDAIRKSRPEKPDPPEKGAVADVPLFVSCFKDHVKIFRDMSGESLHRRGYRDAMHRAALNESAAAGVLHLAGWPQALQTAGDGADLVLADPMCGSGTLLIEAALMARDIAPGLIRSLDLTHTEPSATAGGGGAAAAGSPASGGRRHAPLAAGSWPFQRWGDYDAGVWEAAVAEARERVRPAWRGRLLGVELHAGALSLAVRQAKKAGVYDMLELTQDDCGRVVPSVTPQFVVTNPPWGGRLVDGGGGGGQEGFGGRGSRGARRGDGANWRGGYGADGRGGEGEEGGEAYLEGAWRSLDSFLYRHCPGASATVISGNRDAFKYLKLKPHAKHELTLSGVSVQVASYQIRDLNSRSPSDTSTTTGPSSHPAETSQHPPSSTHPHTRTPGSNTRSMSTWATEPTSSSSASSSAPAATLEMAPDLPQSAIRTAPGETLLPRRPAASATRSPLRSPGGGGGHPVGLVGVDGPPHQEVVDAYADEDYWLSD